VAGRKAAERFSRRGPTLGQPNGRAIRLAFLIGDQRNNSEASVETAFITGSITRPRRLRELVRLLTSSIPTPTPAPKAISVVVPGFSRV
jgi:hypothetical protein